MYFVDTVLFGAFRHQAGDAHSDVGMGVPFRVLRVGQSRVWLFVLSMLVYGVAFDFFNVSGSLFVDKETDISIRSSAQGLFMMMTNGLGATIGTLSAQAVINRFVYALPETASGQEVIAGWNTCWYIFAAYALVVAALFAIFFKYKHVVKDECGR